VIVLATGFQTNNGLGSLRIQGRGGEWLEDHWKKLGGPGAYNNTAVHGCNVISLRFPADEPDIWLDPNFLMIYGPNSTTGHNSVLFTIENMVDYALKVAEPIIKGEASEIEVKEEAEKEHLRRLQEASSDKLWNTCKSVRLCLLVFTAPS
jgi:hypothetical protein